MWWKGKLSTTLKTNQMIKSGLEMKNELLMFSR